MAIYPKNFTGVFIIAYGIMGKVSNIDPDKVYDYHTAFDIQKKQVVYNVDINANNKKILNIALDKSRSTSAATVGMVKELLSLTKKYFYSQYFEKIYDFTDANNYGISKISSGVIINYLNHYNHINNTFNITIPNRTLKDIKKDGLNISDYIINFSTPIGTSNYTLCIVFYHWVNRSFSLVKKNPDIGLTLMSLSYTYATKKVELVNI